MSGNRRKRINLLNNDCFANNKLFDRRFSGARRERDGAACEKPITMESLGQGVCVVAPTEPDVGVIDPRSSLFRGWLGCEDDDRSVGQSLHGEEHHTKALRP